MAKWLLLCICLCVSIFTWVCTSCLGAIYLGVGNLSFMTWIATIWCFPVRFSCVGISMYSQFSGNANRTTALLLTHRPHLSVFYPTPDIIFPSCTSFSSPSVLIVLMNAWNFFFTFKQFFFSYYNRCNCKAMCCILMWRNVDIFIQLIKLNSKKFIN